MSLLKRCLPDWRGSIEAIIVLLYFISLGTQPCFVVFDILMINHINLANCPLRERIEHMNKLELLIPTCRT